MLWPLAALAAMAVPSGDPILVTLNRCLRAPEAPLVDRAATVPPPPGLVVGRARVAPIAGGVPGAFAYESVAGAGCGIALYGPVSRGIRRAVAAALAAVPGWRPFTPTPPPPKDVRESGWGLPPNSTMYGAILYRRRPSPAAPTIEVVRYAVLVP